MATQMDLDEAFEKATGKPTASGDTLEKLPDGDYLFEFQKLELKEPQGKPLVEYTLEVIEGQHDGTTVKHTNWLASSEKAGEPAKVNEVAFNILKGDLAALGFDVAEWTRPNSRPFIAELRKAMPLIRGLKFKAKKKSKAGDKGKVYHSLYVGERLTFNGEATDGKPLKFGPAELAAANADEFSLDD